MAKITLLWEIQRMSEKLKEAQAWLRENVDAMINATFPVGRPVFGSEEAEALRELAIDRTCATCKWARPSTGDDMHKYSDMVQYPLICTLANTTSSPLYSIDEGGPGGQLAVTPTFGCVQWREK